MMIWLAIAGLLGGNAVMLMARAWNLGLLWNSALGAGAALVLGWAMPGWPGWAMVPGAVGIGAATTAVLGALNALRYRG